MAKKSSKKSSLKTFLAGKNPWVKGPNSWNPFLQSGLSLAVALDVATHHSEADEADYYLRGDAWFTDVLSDGTAITYCAQ